MNEMRRDEGLDTSANGGDTLVITVREAAGLLHINPILACQLARRGELPAVKLGSRVLRVRRRGLEMRITRQETTLVAAADRILLATTSLGGDHATLHR